MYCEKNDFVEISKNLARNTDEKFCWTIKIIMSETQAWW